MPETGSRKRPAPGASPTPQTSAQQSLKYNSHASQAPADQFLQWKQNNNVGATPANPNPSETFDAPISTSMTRPSNQLARRSGNGQMVARAPYNGTENGVWAGGVVPQQLQPQQAGQIPWQDDDVQLDQKAAEAKKTAQSSRKSIPPFVQKLSRLCSSKESEESKLTEDYSFLDESRNTELIRWSPKGDSFVVLDEDEFARTLIPELFKHNNYASFVRQLNMYGFHKRVGLSDNSMRASERKNKSPSEYYNPFFKRGRPNLLWLIQKPKPAASGGKKGRGNKGEDNGDEDVEDGFDGDNIPTINQGQDENGSGFRNRQPLLIEHNESGLAREELTQVHQELQAIRSQQSQIAGVIQKIRREHEQLYGQAAAFQELHSRHENSINAILTFLATVYNRSLEGHANQDMANLFTGAIPHNMQQPQGSVVDVGDFRSPGVDTPGIVRRPSGRKPLLLQAPPSGNTDGSPSGNSASSQQRPQTRSSTNSGTYGQHQNPGAVEEIYEPESMAATPQSQDYSRSNLKDGGTPEGDFMSFINSANARDTNGAGSRMDFPQALSHLQNADGKSPLSPMERNSVLQLMASNNANGNNNALTSPDPPNIPTPNLENWNATAQDLRYLEKTLKEQNDKVESLSSMLQPLSPSGSIPGLSNPVEYAPGPEGPLDFNQIFNSEDYFNDANNAGLDFSNGGGDFTNGGDFTFDNPAENGVLADGYDADGVDDSVGGRVVETVDSSEATSPANTVVDGGQEEVSSPRKRRRRN